MYAIVIGVTGLAVVCLWMILRNFKLQGDLINTRAGLRYVIEQMDAEQHKLEESEKERKWLKNKVLQKEVENRRALEDRTAMYNSLCSLLDTLYLAPVERCKTKLERRLSKVLFHIDQQIHGKEQTDE